LETSYDSTDLWILKSGTVVNDILKERDRRPLAAMGIIDHFDGITRGYFSDEDWEEIIDTVDRGLSDMMLFESELPELGDSIEDFRKKGSALVETPDKNFPWLGLPLLNISLLYSTLFLLRPHGERTYDCIWSGILDVALAGTELYITRGELESASIKNLRNKDRTIGVPIRNSPKYDGIIQSYDSDRGQNSIEYGFLEVANHGGRAFETKLLTDRLKLVKGMCASVLDVKPNHSNPVRVSIQTSGRQMRILLLTYGGGSIKILTRRTMVELPRVFDGNAIHDVLHEVAGVRDILVRERMNMRNRV